MMATEKTRIPQCGTVRATCFIAMGHQALTEERMKKLSMSLVLVVGLLGVGSIYRGQDAVEYVKVCSLYGTGFHYIPGTDICLDDFTGDTRQETAGGTWRTLLPYPEGRWVKDLDIECLPGRLVTVGKFLSTDFALNAWDRKQTPPFSRKLSSGEYISKVIMSGGFYDPRIPDRHGVSDPYGMDGLCVRSIDPSLLEQGAAGPFNPPFGNGLVPIGCVANSGIVNMPAAYSINATAAYPDIDSFFLTSDQTSISGPYVYGSALVVTTDLGPGGPDVLTYYDAVHAQYQPLAGTLRVSVCVDGSGLR
jgi:hypothetical protein